MTRHINIIEFKHFKHKLNQTCLWCRWKYFQCFNKRCSTINYNT